MVDKPTWFEIDATSQFNFTHFHYSIFRNSIDAGNGAPEVVLTNPHGRQDVVPVSVKQTTPGKYRCEYVPREPGSHTVNVLFAGRPIPNSPFPVNVSPCM